MIICKIDSAVCGNLLLFVKNIWWSPKKAVILHRISEMRVLIPAEKPRKRVRNPQIDLINNTIMKKVFFSLLTFVSLVAGVTFINAAQNTNDNFTVRFRENTLVVTSTQMEEARIYSMQGKLLQKEKGKFVEFPLERGTYRLYAKVNGETLTRRIELR